MIHILSCALAVSCGVAAASAADFSPKYAPLDRPYATPLRESRRHIQAKPAPDYWALSPYYEGMRGGHSASAASAAMALNALRKDTRYSSSDELVTEAALLKHASAGDWASRLEGEKPKGVTLAELGKIMKSILAGYGVKDRTASVVSVEDNGAKAVARVRALLVENEASDKNILIARYMQSAFTGDPEGAVGTFSPVGAFDAANDRVLILETDRKYYEPYWVSLKTFVGGLSSLKAPDGKAAEGGLLWIR